MIESKMNADINFITWQQVNDLIDYIIHELKGKNPTGVYGIPRAGLIPATIIAYKMNIPLLLAPTPGCIIIDDDSTTGSSFKHYMPSEHQQWKYHLVALIAKTPEAKSFLDVYGMYSEKQNIFPWDNTSKEASPWLYTEPVEAPKEAQPHIVAVDFDETIAVTTYKEDGTYKVEAVNDKLILILKDMAKRGIKLILWTCRIGSQLKDAIDFCEERGLHFDAINSNINTQLADTRKVVADMYIDDRAITLKNLEKAYYFGG